jgi:hypothetical protein
LRRKEEKKRPVSAHFSSRISKVDEKDRHLFQKPREVFGTLSLSATPHTIVRFHFLHRPAPYQRLFFPSPPLSGHFPTSCTPIPGKSPCQPKPRFTDKKKAIRQKQKNPLIQKDEGTFI